MFYLNYLGTSPVLYGYALVLFFLTQKSSVKGISQKEYYSKGGRVVTYATERRVVRDAVD